MDRRDFLKSLGLGGLALTLPKPLKVVAARMSDIEAPPIQLGLARFRDLGGILVSHFSLTFRSLPPLDRTKDFMENWSIHLAAHEEGRDYVEILRGPAAMFLQDGPSGDPKFRYHLPTRLLTGTMLDLHIVPEGMPRFTLPPIVATLHGEGARRGNGFLSNGNFPIVMTGHMAEISVQVRSVRLERTRALELGLVSPSDPFEAL